MFYSLINCIIMYIYIDNSAVMIMKHSILNI